MTLQQLNYLVTVAECGNITEAAEKLYISQPSLSTAIHNLEKEMGVTAFVRSNKGVVVTREGEELLSYARMLLEQADNMKEHFGSGDRICYHGVCDMFRNPKLAAAVYSSQQDEDDVLEISSSMDIGEHPACLCGSRLPEGPERDQVQRRRGGCHRVRAQI